MDYSLQKYVSKSFHVDSIKTEMNRGSSMAHLDDSLGLMKQVSKTCWCQKGQLTSKGNHLFQPVKIILE